MKHYLTPPLPTEAVYYTPQEVINEIELKSIIGNPPYNDKKKDKNKKENWGGPHKRKAPKKIGANRAQQKTKSKHNDLNFSDRSIQIKIFKVVSHFS